MKNREQRIYDIRDISRKERPEVAIIGRSNAGKSSLLNLLVGGKIAKVSKTPGCTLWLGLHVVEGATVVDLPGYGYARAPEQRLEVVDKLVEKYIALQRTDAVLLLVDSRRGMSEMDWRMMELFSWARVMIVGTKADKKDSMKTVDFNFVTSSLNKSGIDQIKSYIRSLSEPAG